MITIIADSTCDLDAKTKEKYNIDIIPLHIHMGDMECEDGIDTTSEEIIKWSDDNKTTPKTSAPSIDTAIKILKSHIDKGEEIIAFSISQEMSSSGNVIRMAACELDASDKVTVIDSRNLSTGIGLLAVEASVLAKEGLSREEITKKIENYIPKVRASFVVDTLTFLHRGGRCSGLSAMLGAAIKLHPRIVVRDGKMSSDKKYRGKMKSVVLSYVKSLEEDMKNAKPDRVFITHSPIDSDIVDAVRQYLQELNIFADIIETDAGGVVCSHCGPGTLGVLFISK